MLFNITCFIILCHEIWCNNIFVCCQQQQHSRSLTQDPCSASVPHLNTHAVAERPHIVIPYCEPSVDMSFLYFILKGLGCPLPHKSFVLCLTVGMRGRLQSSQDWKTNVFKAQQVLNSPLHVGSEERKKNKERLTHILFGLKILGGFYDARQQFYLIFFHIPLSLVLVYLLFARFRPAGVNTALQAGDLLALCGSMWPTRLCPLISQGYNATLFKNTQWNSRRAVKSESHEL